MLQESRAARFAVTEKKLAAKATKAASEDVRISTDKINAAARGRADFPRLEQQERDSRVVPGWCALALIQFDGERLIVPMRYRCRRPGWTEVDEKQKPGIRNASGTFLTT
ncbi:hypothetical protein [Burkholderia contaminans]|uniref:hypothetical protein n=1 Tax=Burkholderia contaminans TaxID=488447 RepID=UPI00210EF48F|nr:hypothetical protein [Burkholderia contaminans]